MPHRKGAKENVESLTQNTHMHRRRLLARIKFDQPHELHTCTHNRRTHTCQMYRYVFGAQCE